MGDICFVTHAINGLGLANNSRVQVTNVRTHSSEVMGDNEGQRLRIPRITFKFRMPMENHISSQGGNFHCVWLMQ
jgi:hypothetical protein